MKTFTIKTARRSPSDVQRDVEPGLGEKVLVHGKLEAAFLCPHKNSDLGAWVIQLDHAGDPMLQRYPSRSIEAVRAK